jgi:heme/copper-type cytochrome/quinol oxidase subunit 2
MQGVIEPVEEVGYKARPPLLEDVSVEGPFRTPVPHALDTLQERDAIEEDYNWWRYSGLAAGWLIFLLLLFVTLFTMTAYEQVGTIKALRNGTPRYYQLQVISDSDHEAGIEKMARQLRSSLPWFSILPAVLTIIVLLAKPRPNVRKILFFFIALMFLTGAILGIIAFAVSESEHETARRCPELYQITMEDCIDREGIAVAATALDFFIFISCLTAAIALVWGAVTGDFALERDGWRERERDMSYNKKAAMPGAIKAENRRRTVIIFILITVIFAFCIGVADMAFTIVLHQDHDTVHLRSYRGRTSLEYDDPPIRFFEEPGWSARNTRLRYAWTSIGILTVLANLLPWRSRVIAWVFAFIYFCIGVLAMVSFGFDVHEMRESRKHGCPNTAFDVPYAFLQGEQVAVLAPFNTRVNCINSPYVALVILEFIVTIIVILYLIFEYFLRFSSVHSQRKYTWFEIGRQERALDSRRPVRDELTSQVMTAKEYYYRHRFLAGPEPIAAPIGLTGQTVTPFMPPMIA